MTYEAKLKKKIAERGNTSRVYILQRVPAIAAEYAKVAAHLAFLLQPELREN